MDNFALGVGSVLIAFFIAAGFTIYTFIKANHLERMAKIQKGIDPSAHAKARQYLALKLGMLMVGTAAGLLVAYLAEQTFHTGEIVFYPCFMLLFGGSSLIGSFFWARELEKKQ